MQEVQKSYLIRGNTGGGDRTRTGGLYVANVALFQLSYTPNMIELRCTATRTCHRGEYKFY